MKRLQHNPFRTLKGRPLAQIIRLPVRQDPDGAPVHGAPAQLIAFPFGATKRSAKFKSGSGSKVRVRSSHHEIMAVHAEECRRGSKRR